MFHENLLMFFIVDRISTLQYMYIHLQFTDILQVILAIDTQYYFGFLAKIKKALFSLQDKEIHCPISFVKI